MNNPWSRAIFASYPPPPIFNRASLVKIWSVHKIPPMKHVSVWLRTRAKTASRHLYSNIPLKRLVSFIIPALKGPWVNS